MLRTRLGNLEVAELHANRSHVPSQLVNWSKLVQLGPCWLQSVVGPKVDFPAYDGVAVKVTKKVT